MATATETLERISADPDLVRRAEERELSKFFYQSSIVNAEKRGKAEGKLEGKAETLLLLLQAKFGEVPESIQVRLRQGTDDELTHWIQRVLTATSLDDVFDS